MKRTRLQKEIMRQLTKASIIYKKLLALEKHLMRPDIRKSMHGVDAILDDGFIEFGSAGQIISKRQVLAWIPIEPPAKWTMSSFRATLLARNVALVTYRVTKKEKEKKKPVHSLRSSVFVLRNRRWQMIFHQGTTTTN
jgi:hypothetical protein